MRGATLQRGRNLFVLKPIGRQQHDATAQHHPCRRRTPARLLLQLPPDIFFENNGLSYTHSRSPHHKMTRET